MSKPGTMQERAKAVLEKRFKPVGDLQPMPNGWTAQTKVFGVLYYDGALEAMTEFAAAEVAEAVRVEREQVLSDAAAGFSKLEIVNAIRARSKT